MAILAGIDEAGLGPRLGPLVVSATALRVPDDWQPETPWRACADAVIRAPRRRDARPVVADSKVVYARGGATALGRTVFAFVHAQDPDRPLCRSAPLSALLHRLGAKDVPEHLAEHPWYDEPEDLPEAPPTDEGDGPAVLHRVLREQGARVARLEARPLLEGRFNDAVLGGFNKSEILLKETGLLITALAEAFPAEEMRLTIDRQGGRKFYHPFLAPLFPGLWIDILKETEAASVYCVRREAGRIRIAFEVRAEKSAFCAALSSILAKYVRERFMERLNRFFARRLPGLKATAGYPGDAARFIRAVQPILEAIHVPPARFVRMR
ncbi:MAG: hypothetical protein V1918_02740 [Planctomycetota bacterium]